MLLLMMMTTHYENYMGPEVKSTPLQNKTAPITCCLLFFIHTWTILNFLNPPILLVVVGAAKSEPTLISSNTAGDCSQKRRKTIWNDRDTTENTGEQLHAIQINTKDPFQKKDNHKWHVQSPAASMASRRLLNHSIQSGRLESWSSNGPEDAWSSMANVCIIPCVSIALRLFHLMFSPQLSFTPKLLKLPAWKPAWSYSKLDLKCQKRLNLSVPGMERW